MHISIYCIVLFVCSTQTFNCVLEQYTSIVIFNKSRHLLLLCKKTEYIRNIIQHLHKRKIHNQFHLILMEKNL